MALRLTDWEDSDHFILPVGLTIPSIVSVDTILLDAPKESLSVDGTPRAAETQIDCFFFNFIMVRLG